MPEVITDNLDLWTSALLTKSTAGRGSNGKLEAYGIRKLRALILELAVRGKLVPQDPNDEPASELLELIETEKALLNLSSRKRSGSDDLLQESTDINLPRGWVSVPASALFPTKSGNSKLIKGKLHSKPADGLFPGYSASGQDVWLEDWDQEGVAIILSAVGARCGKAFLAEGKWSAVANTHIVWVMPKITLPAFAMLHLNNEAFWVRSGGAQPFVKVGETLERSFELPPLAEQKRIVAKVDELMALCDQLEQQQTDSLAAHQTLVETLLGTLTHVESQQEFSAAWARIASHFDTLFTTENSIDQLKQTILQLAVMGKLVPQDPNDEPASELLKKIAAEKAKLVKEGKIKKEKPLSPIGNDEKSFELPEKWEWSQLGVLVDFKTGNLDSNAGVEGGSYPFFTCAKEPLAINEYAFDCEAVLLAGNNASGNFNVKHYKGKFNAYQRTYVITTEFGDQQALSYRYLKYVLVYLLQAFQEKSIGTLTKYLTLGILKPVALALPPLAEQHRIVAKVDELMALCDALMARIADAQTTQIHLADAIVEQAVC